MSMFKKVEDNKIGAKVLVYGDTSTGKTLFALSFPNVVAIDSEDGMAFYRKNKNLKYILQTTSASDLEDGMDEIEDMEDIQTLVIDSETKIYENLQHSGLAVAERRAKQKGQDVGDVILSVREWGKIKLINKRLQSTKIELASKGINIVSIVQEKPVKEKRGEEWVVVGYAPDTAKGLEYDYDIILRAFTKSEKGEEKYYMEVKKDRTQKYKKGTILENCGYKDWEDVFTAKSQLKEHIVDYKKDIERDIVATESEEELAEQLYEEFKKITTSLQDKTKLKNKLAEMKIEAKDIKTLHSKQLQEIIDHIK
jgi:KaiC/GvpD/RAD55 family RecA-like ATPase